MKDIQITERLTAKEIEDLFYQETVIQGTGIEDVDDYAHFVDAMWDSYEFGDDGW